MAKKRVLSQKLREEIISLHQKGNGFRKTSKTLKLPKDTVGCIIHKFKTHGTAAKLAGHGSKSNIPPRGIRHLKTTAEKSPCITAKDLQQDLMKAGTKAQKKST